MEHHLGRQRSTTCRRRLRACRRRLDRAADAIVADLTHDADARIATLAPPRPPTLAFFSHVETGVRTAALAAGIELVVPRSRIAREGVSLLAALLATER